MSAHDLHSRHVDSHVRVLEAVDAVVAVLPTGARTMRDDIADDLIELIETHVRRGQAIPELRLDMLSRDDWADGDGREITAWKKRREYRHPDTGALVGAVDLETDESIWGSQR